MAKAVDDAGKYFKRDAFVMDIGGTKVDVSTVWEKKGCIKDLVTALNQSSFKNKSYVRVRVETCPPTVYCVVINLPKKDGKPLDLGGWKLCKVGVTMVDAHPYKKKEKGTRNKTRMDDIIDAAKDSGHEGVKPIFSFPIGFFDSRSPFAVEKDVRLRMGYPVHRNLARDFNLPIPTEWVLVAQLYLTNLMAIIKAIKEDRTGNILSTDLFYQEDGCYEEFLMAKSWPKLPDWLEISGKGEVMRAEKPEEKRLEARSKTMSTKERWGK
ncbi:uncharacterized protein LOC134188977 [Corticium candelabrum]|uniref:uncharacterized protein LOC134188977 n=1 Tax=Corticium candelabrum TaxID=121492 RepID=UPI002E27466E|nr:uncharacterized protein LOC134188977 [Corticium candelabrum]